MNIPEEAIDAASDAIRDNLMRVHPNSRPRVLDMIARSVEAAAPFIAARAWDEGHTRQRETEVVVDDDTGDARLVVTSYQDNPYRAAQ